MTSARVGPHSGPRPLAQRSTGEQDAVEIGEDVDRKRQMQRRLDTVDVRLETLADRLAGVIEDNKLIGGYAHRSQLALLAVGTREL